MRRYLSIALPNWSFGLKGLERIAFSAMRLTPLVQIDIISPSSPHSRPLYGLTLDITGTMRLHQSEEKLANKIISKFTKKNIHSQIAIASTISASWALAHYCNTKLIIISEEQLEAALANLPIAALRVTPKTVELLKDLGLCYIKDLLKLPKESLRLRFEKNLVLHLEQAIGKAPEIFKPVRIPINFLVSREFYSPISNLTALRIIFFELLEEVTKKLQSHASAANLFNLNIQHFTPQASQSVFSKQLNLAEASNRLSELKPLFEPLLEKLHIENGITKISIEALQTETKAKEHLDFVTETSFTTKSLVSNQLLNNLVSRLGRLMKKVQYYESYIPEKSFGFVAWQDSSGERANFLAHNRGGFNLNSSTSPNRQTHTQVSPVAESRPPIFLNPAQPILAIALLPDNPPHWFKWHGKEYRIRCAEGPERIAPEWWHSVLDLTATQREYFKVQDQTGQWFWIYRNGSEWFIQGIWC